MFNFGQRLHEIRNHTNLTQKKFAELIGISERGLQNYELNLRKPNIDVLIAILENIDISADYLLGRTDNPKGSRYDEAH